MTELASAEALVHPVGGGRAPVDRAVFRRVIGTGTSGVVLLTTEPAGPLGGQL